jgi:hypothetical protein
MFYNPTFNVLCTPLSFEVDLFLSPSVALSSTTSSFRFVKQPPVEYRKVLALTRGLCRCSCPIPSSISTVSGPPTTELVVGLAAMLTYYVCIYFGSLKCRLRLKCDGTGSRTGGEVEGKLANGVGIQYSSHYLGTRCIQHYYR